jgi:hypothetical protein
MCLALDWLSYVEYCNGICIELVTQMFVDNCFRQDQHHVVRFYYWLQHCLDAWCRRWHTQSICVGGCMSVSEHYVHTGVCVREWVGFIQSIFLLSEYSTPLVYTVYVWDSVYVMQSVSLLCIYSEPLWSSTGVHGVCVRMCVCHAECISAMHIQRTSVIRYL